MKDPLSQVISLLRPSATFSKLVTAAGHWMVQPPGLEPSYNVVLDGECELSIVGRTPLRLSRGDFFLVPAAHRFTVSSLVPPPAGLLTEPIETSPGSFQLGEPGEHETRMLVGHYAFSSDNASLLVSLLPGFVILRGEQRLMPLVELLREEARADQPSREVVLAHLLEALLIKAFRAASRPSAVPGLLRGLADERLAVALRQMHGDPTRPWTISEMAREAALSRATFFDRFRRKVGVAPMEYLLSWRMAIAKDLLKIEGFSVAEASRRVGYRSSSAFSVAFTRQFGFSPTAYVRGRRPSAATTDEHS